MDRLLEAYLYHTKKFHSARDEGDVEKTAYHDGFSLACRTNPDFHKGLCEWSAFAGRLSKKFEIRKVYGSEESTESFPLYLAQEDLPAEHPIAYGVYANLPDGTQTHVADFFNIETAGECLASYENSVLLLDADQARPILREYLVKLYRESEPTEELRVTCPDGQYAEIFPAYWDDGGLLQVNTYDDPEGNLNDSQTMDKFRSKKRFYRNLDNQVDELLEILGLIKWGIKNAYVGEFWEKNGKPLTFSSKRLAQKYADSTQWEGGIEHDAKESQVVIFEPAT